MMKKREQKDIWHGLYDFYLVEKKRSVKIESLLDEDSFLKTLTVDFASLEISTSYKHILSHQIIISKFIVIQHPKAPIQLKKAFRFYSTPRIAELPKPVLISRFLSDYHLL